MIDSKLNVYTIHLNRKTNSELSSFKDLLLSKYKHSDEEKNITPVEDIDNKSDAELMKLLLTDFINILDKQEYYSDKRTSKGIGVDKVVESGDICNNMSIRIKSNTNIIVGRICGGKYGKKRIKSKIDNQNVKDPIVEKDIILDDFFFMLYTPMNHDKGIFMIQSYPEETVNPTVKKLISDVLIGYTNYKKVVIEPFFPAKIKEEYKNSSVVNSISLTGCTKNVTVGSSETEKNYTDSFDIKLQIIPRGEKSKTLLEYIPDVIRKLFPNNDIDQSEFKTKVQLVNENDRTVSFEIDRNINDIKPVIYLGSVLNLTDDLDENLNLIETYSLSLLEDIKKEIYGKGSNEVPLLSESGN